MALSFINNVANAKKIDANPVNETDSVLSEQQLNSIAELLKIPPEKREFRDIEGLAKLLIQIKFFYDIVHGNDDDYDTLYALCKKMTYERVPKDSVVFEIKSIGRTFYIVLNGKVGVNVVHHQAMGKSSTSMGTYIENDKSMNDGGSSSNLWLYEVSEIGPGGSFGELALLSDYDTPRLATIICKQDSDFAVLTKSDYKEILAKNHSKSLQARIDFFTSLPLFMKESERNITKMMYHFEQLNLTKNDVIYKEGDDATKIYVIRKGEVKLIKQFEYPKTGEEEEAEERDVTRGFKIPMNTKKTFEIALLTPGELFGAEEVYYSKKRLSTAICASINAEVYGMPKTELFSRLKGNDYLIKYMENYCRRKREWRENHIAKLNNTLKSSKKLIWKNDPLRLNINNNIRGQNSRSPQVETLNNQNLINDEPDQTIESTKESILRQKSPDSMIYITEKFSPKIGSPIKDSFITPFKQTDYKFNEFEVYDINQNITSPDKIRLTTSKKKLRFDFSEDKTYENSPMKMTPNWFPKIDSFTKEIDFSQKRSKSVVPSNRPLLNDKSPLPRIDKDDMFNEIDDPRWYAVKAKIQALNALNSILKDGNNNDQSSNTFNPSSNMSKPEEDNSNFRPITNSKHYKRFASKAEPIYRSDFEKTAQKINAKIKLLSGIDKKPCELQFYKLGELSIKNKKLADHLCERKPLPFVPTDKLKNNIVDQIKIRLQRKHSNSQKKNQFAPVLCQINSRKPGSIGNLDALNSPLLDAPKMYNPYNEQASIIINNNNNNDLSMQTNKKNIETQHELSPSKLNKSGNLGMNHIANMKSYSEAFIDTHEKKSENMQNISSFHITEGRSLGNFPIKLIPAKNSNKLLFQPSSTFAQLTSSMSRSRNQSPPSSFILGNVK